MTRLLPSAVLLALPTVLAFATGGYNATSRTLAGVVVWALAALALTRGKGGTSLALAGLTALTAWTLVSTVWAPDPGRAWALGQITVLYLGAFVAADGLLGDRRLLRAVEPALAAGILVVALYALGDRLLPGLLDYADSLSAKGRLEQPITYWNGLGALLAMGLVLAARLAGDTPRPPWISASAVAAAAPLGAAISLTFSRGALFAAAAGLLVVVLAAARRTQLEAAALTAGTAVLAGLAIAPFDLNDTQATSTDGLLALVLLLVLAGTAAALRPAIAQRPATLRVPRGAWWATLALVIGVLAIAASTGGEERVSLSGGGQRLTSLTSNRYAYWEVGVRAWADRPLEGVGAGGWATAWRMDRDVADSARDAHSLAVQTLAELGIVGLALLLTWLAGVARAARPVLEERAGLAALVATWATHAAFDWDFQLPGVTLAAVIAMGALTAARRSAAPRA